MKRDARNGETVYFVTEPDGAGIRHEQCSPNFTSAKERDKYMFLKGWEVSVYKNPENRVITVPQVYDSAQEAFYNENPVKAAMEKLRKEHPIEYQSYMDRMFAQYQEEMKRGESEAFS